ncbi:diaminopimelate epimerase [Euzebya sp.]|uniref:diaminopimelate epimerase n=1 Tax=Euzebya sp. TaxID=1971409 RepID=UPI0035152EFD
MRPADLPFTKVHGAGNDFVLLCDLEDALDLPPAAVRALCDRRRGIGGDGVIRVGAPRAGVDADVFMDYRNADGSIAEMCGNGVRTVAKYVADRGIVEGDVVRVDTRAGTKHVRCHRGSDGRVTGCTVDMGAPVPGVVGEELVLGDGSTVTVTTVSMGNPHAVIVVDDVAAAPVHVVGPLLERHEVFGEGTNVEFITVPDRGTVHGRIWERGVGETLASGTGGSAMAVAAALVGLADREVDVHLPGGILTIAWTDETLFVTGPAVEVASGIVDETWWATATGGT